MLILKYSKTGDAKYIPHVDTLRVLIRTLRRAGVKVEMSQGFNPHMLLNMSPPLPVGHSSVTEFVEIVTAAPIEGFIDLFNKNCPAGFAALKVWQTEKSPKITANTAAAEYTAETDIFDGLKISIDEPKLYNLTQEKGRLTFTTACGNNNLRPDRLLDALINKYGLAASARGMKITREKLFAGTPEKLILMDEFI